MISEADLLKSGMSLEEAAANWVLGEQLILIIKDIWNMEQNFLGMSVQ